MFGSVFAQPQVDDIANSLNRGEIANVAKYFDKVVDVTINNDVSTYSKSQAEMVVKNFLVKNATQSFSIRDRGPVARDNSMFLIGDLKTANGLFKVYIFLKQKERNYLLQRIKFEQ